MKKSLVVLLAIVAYLCVTTTCATVLETETGGYDNDQYIAELTKIIRLDPNNVQLYIWQRRDRHR